MPQIGGHDKLLFSFVPDEWIPAERFIRFIGPPFLVTKELTHSVRTCHDHLDKFEIFANLLNKLLVELPKDNIELNENGFSPTARSRECAAVLEVMICELYSCLDGIRGTIFHIYKNMSGVQNKSTEKLFNNARDGKYDVKFPSYLVEVLKEAEAGWFKELRFWRVEITHGNVGNCRLNDETKTVEYSHYHIKKDGTPLIIKDILSKLEQKHRSVLELTGRIYGYFYDQLEKIEAHRPFVWES